MGNANGHVSDRRKSLSGGAPSAQVSIISNEFNPHSAHNANVGSPVIQPLGAVRIFSIVCRTKYCKVFMLIFVFRQFQNVSLSYRLAQLISPKEPMEEIVNLLARYWQRDPPFRKPFWDFDPELQQLTVDHTTDHDLEQQLLVMDLLMEAIAEVVIIIYVSLNEKLCYSPISICSSTIFVLYSSICRT